ncbi:GNAT family N-acetyltransferase [Vibrio tritonius]|uniref:GNAT family N-acetyltransferase n=1 Tax=Vibrio tritonius TaxID=1435069 RepID=UPI00315D7305
MNSSLSYLKNIRDIAKQNNGRFGVVLEHDIESAKALCLQFSEVIGEQHVFALGTSFDESRVLQLESHQGQQLLGRECQLLIWNLSAPWDANSFSAALGTLCGGGLLLFVGRLAMNHSGDKWLSNQLKALLYVGESRQSALPELNKFDYDVRFEQQHQVISLIKKVISGHRKRPLILTADRGRGKTSALGIASAQLMQERQIHIIVTAPSSKAVQPLYKHLLSALPSATRSKDIVTFGESSLRFMAPDHILLDKPECDLLIVDEAAALPIPILQAFVEHYHRMVFSSTINGYEGCGRGFTLKFQSWLAQHRPSYRAFHINQPIRWANNDFLEAWQKQTFLLDYDLKPIALDDSELRYLPLDKHSLLTSPETLQNVFSILVNAHYQTSPNDLFQLLADSNTVVWIAMQADTIVGCLMAVKEGGLDNKTVEQICQGKRRPKGHLAAVSIANQVGITLAALQTSYRIMRIAVHPSVQSHGIGSQLITKFCQSAKVDFVTTSFGVTEPLLKFWSLTGFEPIRLGTKRDQASGCHSLLMVKSVSVDWVEQAQTLFYQHLQFELNDSFQYLDPEIVRWFMSHKVNISGFNQEHVRLIERYVLGGSNYESCAFAMAQLLVNLKGKEWERVSRLLVCKVLQKWTWSHCASSFSLSGRKQVESKMRESFQVLLSDLQCKVDW